MAVCVTVATLLGGCSTGHAESATLTRLNVGERPAAPHLQGAALDGSAVDTDAWAGDVIVINFWGSWCAPCIQEAPALAYLARTTRHLGVRFLGIDVRDDRASARAFQRAHDIPYPSLFDEGGDLQVQFRRVPPSVIPSTIIIDRQGRIAVRFIGAILLTSLRQEIRAVAREAAADPPSKQRSPGT